MSLRPVFADLILPLASRGAGALGTGPVSNPGQANIVEFFVVVTAVSGSTQTLDVTIQTSPDASTWTTLAASSITQISSPTPPVQTHSFGFAAVAEYAQVLATVGGTGTPLVTYAVGVVVI